MKRILLLLLLSLLGGCLLPDYRDEDSGYRLVLHRPVTVPPERARVFIQEGRVTGTGFDSYRVSCNLEVRRLSERPQVIEPDTFVVNRVQAFFEEVARNRWSPRRLAGLGLAGGEVDSGLSDIFRGWHFWLHSPRQPDVIRLTCRGVFAAPWEAVPPTLEEIAEALGAVATLKRGAGALLPGRYGAGWQVGQR